MARSVPELFVAFVAFVAEGEHGELGEAAASAGKSGASNNVINHLVGKGLGFYIGFIVLTCFNRKIVLSNKFWVPCFRQTQIWIDTLEYIRLITNLKNVQDI